MERDEMMYAFAIAMAITPVVGRAVPFDCPVQLPAAAVEVRSAPGWTGFVPTFFLLNSVGVTVGQLQERATLRGEYQEVAHNAYRVSFPLDDSKGEKWLMCEYANGQIVQAQRLPDDTQRCDVLYTPDKHGALTIRATCQVGAGGAERERRDQRRNEKMGSVPIFNGPETTKPR